MTYIGFDAPVPCSESLAQTPDLAQVVQAHSCCWPTQGASFGDVNSDGELEVVFATNTGAVYMVAGATGAHGLRGRDAAEALLLGLVLVWPDDAGSACLPSS